MTRSLRSKAVPAALALLALTACVDPKPGDTGVTPVYVYDETSHSVLVWNDINTLYAAAGGAAPAPDRTITSYGWLANREALAWGGMALNPSANLLYLVFEDGTVVRVSNVSNRNGELNQTTDIVYFTLGSASSTDDHLASYWYDQAGLDPTTGTLYAVEKGASNASRIWVVPSPSLLYNGAIVPKGTLITNSATSDTGGSGMTVGSTGTVMAWFKAGGQLTDPLGTNYDGIRLRLSTGGDFAKNSNVLVGSQVQLGDDSTTFASLAYDSVFNRLYLLRQTTSGAPIVSFRQSQFSLGTFNQAPYAVVAGGSLPSLRFIAHARTKDWMAGGDYTEATTSTGTGTGTNVLRIWKAPSTGATAPSPVQVTLGSTVSIRGVALDGSR